MKKRVHLLILLFCTLCWAGPVQAVPRESAHADTPAKLGPDLSRVKTFPTDSNESVIETGITYNGKLIEFFGSMAGIKADAIIVKLTSPAETVKINVKGRFGPFWMNTRQYEVENVPSIYKIHATGKIDEIISPKLADELGSLDYTRTIRDPLYDKFVRAFMSRKEFEKPVLTPDERRKQEEIAKEIINEIMREEKI